MDLHQSATSGGAARTRTWNRRFWSNPGQQAVFGVVGGGEREPPTSCVRAMLSFDLAGAGRQVATPVARSMLLVFQLGPHGSLRRI